MLNADDVDECCPQEVRMATWTNVAPRGTNGDVDECCPKTYEWRDGRMLSQEVRMATWTNAAPRCTNGDMDEC